ncbi:hypothetical protein Tco_0808839, partial [Tanacetum coccineum]
MLNRHKNWLVHKQTAYGKDFSNPFMVDNLPKIIGFSTHLASLVKSWLVQDQTVLALASPKANELTIPEQTATGKGTSNPFMAGCRDLFKKGLIIPEKESDEFIKSSVEDLVPIPSESEDTSGSDSECDLPSCNDFSLINVSEEKSVTFSNPLFDSNDDFTFSDDESLSDEDVPKDNLVTPLSKLNEDECFDPGGDFILEEIEAYLTSDSIPPGIDDAYFDPEEDILLLEKLLNDDPSSPLPSKELNFEELKTIKYSTDDFPPFDVLGGNFVTFFNPLFDSNEEFTSSDDESPPKADVPEENFMIYS